MKLKNVAASHRASHSKSKKDFLVKYNPEVNTTSMDPSFNRLHIDIIDVQCSDDNLEGDINGDINMDAKLRMHMATGGGAVGLEDSEDDKGNSHQSSDDSFATSSESEASIDK